MSRKLLLLILLIALVLRFVRLGSLPPSLSWDEVAWGYNAYSLGIDGKDEFGRFLPIDYIESFGDFKPPVYAYLDVLPVKLLGLNEFSVRVPSALFGTLTVLLTYLLVKQIFINSKNKNLYAILSALILAVSPWHFMLSRAAFEANVATFFIILGVLFFFKAVNEKKWYLILAVSSFVISLYTFNTARIVSPLLLLFLMFVFRKKILISKKELLISITIGILLFLPMFKFIFSPQASLRFREVNIFSDSSVVALTNTEIQNDNNSLFSKITHNRRLVFSVAYLRHYFDNLNPDFLFIKGDGNPKFSTQDVGELYLWELPFFIAGIFILFKKREGYWWIIPVWLLLGIIPAATARETPHALRIETTLPTFQILSAYGFALLIGKLKKYKNLLVGLFLSLLFLNVVYFLHGYLTHYPREFSGEWQYGYKESIKYVSSVENKYNQIAVTSELGRPYIYYLFYKRIDPADFRKTAKIKREAFGFVTVEGFGKYIFSKDLNLIRGNNILYVNVPGKVPSSANLVKTFYLLNGDKALIAYTL